jgi:hypothetical protein
MKLAVFAFSIGVATATTLTPMILAHAQMGGGHHRRGDGNDQKAAKKPKVDEKAYNAALKTIPDSKEKFDPWGSLGVSSAARKQK